MVISWLTDPISGNWFGLTFGAELGVRVQKAKLELSLNLYLIAPGYSGAVTY